ncbi:MAG: GNAT family N-acetyltransferase [Ktedonobacteraceae bacterium]
METMSFHIRPFTHSDYAAMIAIGRVIYPDYAATEDELRYWDEHRDPAHQFQRWVAEQDGRVVGIAYHSQSMDNYHPRKFWLDITVYPDAQHQGIGSALYEQVVQSVKQYDPLSLRARVREDMLPGIHFLQARGFQDVWREWESRLDVTTFDPSPYRGLEAKLREQGIEVKTLKELESDPECYRQLHEMENEVARDIPSLDVNVTPLSFEQYMDLFINNPQSLPDLHFVAVHHGAYVGTAGLWKSDAETDFVNNLTGVKRPYRHRGIALALKLRCIDSARAYGGSTIKTWNDSPNTDMIALNQQLGFVRKIGWIIFLKDFERESNA